MSARPAGARLLDDLHQALTRYVVLPSPEAADAVVLWIAATHAASAWEHATRLVIKSPEKRCGKSRLLDVIEATCHKPLITVSISPAALVRSITDDDPPTILLDEADTVFGAKVKDNNEDLRGIINAGHGRNRPYKRWDVNRRQVENCPTFAMAALAGIGSMPDTIEDRAVIITMRRRAPGEIVAPYRVRRDRPALENLQENLHNWMLSRAGELEKAEPEMPVDDREADTWESLAAVADAAGADWPARVRKAILIMCSAAADGERSLGVRLLADIRDVFGDGATFIASAEMVTRLRKVDEAPWEHFDLSQRTLAGRLREYGVRSRHNSSKTARGYWREDFALPFASYVPSRSVRASGNESDQQEDSDTSTDTSGPRSVRGHLADASGSAIRPGVSTGQDTSADARTLRDDLRPVSSAGETTRACPDCGEDEDSAFHAMYCLGQDPAA